MGQIGTEVYGWILENRTEFEIDGESGFRSDWVARKNFARTLLTVG